MRKVHWDHPLQVNLEHQLEECPLQIRKIFSWEHSSLKASQSMSWEYSSKLHCFQSQSCPVLPMNQWVKLKGLKPTIGSQASPYSSRPNSLLERYICQGWQKLWSLPHDTFKHFIPSANIKPCEFSAAPCRVIQVFRLGIMWTRVMTEDSHNVLAFYKLREFPKSVCRGHLFVLTYLSRKTTKALTEELKGYPQWLNSGSRHRLGPAGVNQCGAGIWKIQNQRTTRSG